MKILMIVIDGMADEGITPLEKAKTPNMDYMASHGAMGYFINKLGRYPDSDLSNLYLLGYTKKDHPGRGYIEALTVAKPGKNDLCVRCNFATIRRGIITDRRAGREETGLEKLSKKLNMTIDSVTLRFYHTTGHRGILIVKGLSGELTSNDPKATGKKPRTVKAKNKSSRKVAQILNKFLKRSYEILENDPVNRRRRYPANYILLRSFGKYKKVESFKKRYGLSGAVVSATTDINGLGRYLGLTVKWVGDGTPKTNLKAKLTAVKRLLKTKDFVFLHIKAADILSHDHDCEGKRQFIERIDREIMSEVMKLRATIIVTADHICSCRAKDYEHHKGLVPFLLYSTSTATKRATRPSKLIHFDEKNAKRGSLGRKSKKNYLF